MRGLSQAWQLCPQVLIRQPVLVVFSFQHSVAEESIQDLFKQPCSCQVAGNGGVPDLIWTCYRQLYSEKGHAVMQAFSDFVTALNAEARPD